MDIEFFKQFADYLQFGLECFLAFFVLCLSMKRKKRFPLYCGIVLSFVILLSVLFAVIFYEVKSIHLQDYKKITPLLFTCLILPNLFLGVIGYQEHGSVKSFCFVSSIFLRNFVRKIYLLILLAIGKMTNNPDLADTSLISPLFLFLYYPLMGVIFFIIGFLFYRQFKITHLSNIGWGICVIFFFALAVNLSFAPVENSLAKPSAAYTSLLFAEILYSIVVFGLLFLLQRVSEEKLKNNIMAQSLETSKREFELIQENVDLINLKCHDMRHQLREARLEGKLSEKYINDTLHQIDIYDCKTKTGNDVVDIILMDKKFHCNAKKIPFMSVVDGKAVDFMEKEDLIGLLSNILENAINYENRISDEEKRFISLTIAKKNSFTKIHCENAVSETLLPEEKKDPRFHGFGLLSIKSITEKYQGGLNIKKEDGMYQVDILIHEPQDKGNRLV